jgi:hypothetical protein
LDNVQRALVQARHDLALPLARDLEGLSSRERQREIWEGQRLDRVSRELDGILTEGAAILDDLGDGARGQRKTARERVRAVLGYTYP